MPLVDGRGDSLRLPDEFSPKLLQSVVSMKAFATVRHLVPVIPIELLVRNHWRFTEGFSMEGQWFVRLTSIDQRYSVWLSWLLTRACFEPRE